ncbi:MAG: magnesium transporter CorA [Lachnospiraceae bacterium]|nr:magnesium transporter CorA [Lachnospiraceae bacterium]
MYYIINEHLEKVSKEECAKHERPYVAVVSYDEFNKESSFFDLGIDMDLEADLPAITKVEVNYDSLTGCFSIPDRSNVFGNPSRFSFALDEKGIAFINDYDGAASSIIQKIMQTRKWRTPSLERFIYDFLELIVNDDLHFFENYDKKLDELEDKILAGDMDNIMEPLLNIRGEILEIHTHHEQLLDLSQELSENENNFFKPENLRYFDMFSNRIIRLNDIASSLRERVIQVRDLYDSQLNVRQNKISTVLTIVATIFMPLTLIVGWYGMNFKYMPELESPLAYPIIIGICILIVVGSIIFFKKKKWL